MNGLFSSYICLIWHNKLITYVICSHFEGKWSEIIVNVVNFRASVAFCLQMCSWLYTAYFKNIRCEKKMYKNDRLIQSTRDIKKHQYVLQILLLLRKVEADSEHVYWTKVMCRRKAFLFICANKQIRWNACIKLET